MDNLGLGLGAEEDNYTGFDNMEDLEALLDGQEETEMTDEELMKALEDTDNIDWAADDLPFGSDGEWDTGDLDSYEEEGQELEDFTFNNEDGLFEGFDELESEDDDDEEEDDEFIDF